MEFKTSKGEQKIINLLRRGGINFKREVSFEDLTGSGRNLLRFDFALYYPDGRLMCLMEFDGKQHFEFTPYFHKTTFGFKKQQEWDRRKNKYCLMHKIPLIRVPYWDLEELTLKKLFNTPEYIVKTKYHNDYLKKR